MQRTILFPAFFFILATCVAQQYPFVHYSQSEGLVNNRAYDFFQDSKGRLYISTFVGLSIYDGSRFINYTTRNGLLGNQVNDIVEIGDDSLLIIPDMAGLQMLAKGKIRNVITTDNFYPVTNQLIRCSDNTYYAIASDGLFKFNNQRFEKILLKDKAGNGVEYPLFRAIENKKCLFIITYANQYEYPANSKLLIYDLEKKDLIYNDSTLINYFITLTPNNEVLLSTNLGLKLMEFEPGQNKKAAFADYSIAYQLPKDISAGYLFFDRQKNLWVTTSAGIYKIDINGNTRLFSVENGLAVNNYNSVYQDRENIMWFANDQTGITKLANQNFEFYSQIKRGFTTTDIFASPKSDSVWMYDGYHNSALLYQNNIFEEFVNLSSHSTNSKIIQVENKIYLADALNLYKLRVRRGIKETFSQLLYSDPSANNKPGYTLQDKDGNLIILVNNQMVILSNNGKFYKEYFESIADQAALDAKNRLWIPTRSNTIFVFEINTKRSNQIINLLFSIKPNSLPVMSPRSITTDKKGNIWIGTREHGIYCFSTDKQQLKIIKRLTTLEGLSENNISFLFCDSENNIWACSSAGLDKIQIRETRYFIENITRSNNLFQNVKKISTDKQGVHWVATMSGLIKIYPQKISKQIYTPRVLFTEIKAGNSNLAGMFSGISIPYNQHNLSFRVAAPTFFDEKSIQYSYLLEGSNSPKWSEPGFSSEFPFANLPSGKYELKVKAIFLNGRYPDQYASFRFTITPPWWRSWWFLLLVTLLTGMGFLLLVRSYVRKKLQMQKQILEKQQAIEKERTRISLDMHDDLGAGLSRIKFLSDTIRLNSITSPEIKTELDKIALITNDMFDKMGEIIWALDKKNDTLADLISYTRSYAMEYLNAHNIKCQIEYPTGIADLFIGGEFRRNIFLAVKETLHNIVKHAHAANVTISFILTDSVLISIKDDGVGIDLQHIRLKGHGLKNIQQRLIDINGTAVVENKNGTTILLNAPLTT